MMLPRRLHRVTRLVDYPPGSYEPAFMDDYKAQQALLPTLMETRIQSWGIPGSEIDPQISCFLYNGQIPQEITDLIFQYVLSPDARAVNSYTRTPSDNSHHDFCVRNDHLSSSDETTIGQLPLQQVHDGSRPASDSQVDSSAPVEQVNTFTPRPTLPRHRCRDSRGYIAVEERRRLGFDWYRPGCNHNPIYSGWTILLTCRRVYLDAAKFLTKNREIVLFEGREPRGGWSYERFARRARVAYAGPKFRQIPSIRLYSQMFRLDCLADVFEPPRWLSKAFPGLPHNDEKTSDLHWHLRAMLSSGQSPPNPVWRILHNLEAFHLTIRRTDWDRWEDNKALAINPYRANSAAPDLEEMRRDMHASMVDREEMQFDKTAWGRMFRIMANLKQLTITFETSEDKQDEMEDIVEWARTWRFEIMSWRHWMLRDNEEVVAHMVAHDDGPAKKTSWRGLRHHWSDFCPSCSTSISAPKDECPSCLRRERLLEEGKGPRVLTWTRTWSREMVDPPVDLTDTEIRPDLEDGSSRRNTILS